MQEHRQQTEARRPPRPGGFTHEGPGQTDEWLTPSWVFQRIPLRFDLDPCASHHKRTPAGLHYTKDDDGLRRPWHGTVWLNPPYSDPLPWLLRLRQHGDGLALVFARTDTKWWAAARPAAVFLLTGRLQFLRGSDLQQNQNAGSPSALLAYGGQAIEALQRTSLAGGLWLASYVTQRFL